MLSKILQTAQKSPIEPISAPREAKLHPLLSGIVVSAAATATSYLLPEDYASSGVALVFLFSTYVLCLRISAEHPPGHFGLALGGLMDVGALSPVHMARETLRALAQATLVALVVLPPFWWGFVHWYEPMNTFNLGAAFTVEGQHVPLKWFTDMVLWHLIGVALPEEAFFRGYLQTSLTDRASVFGKSATARAALSITLVSLLFALGHLATDMHPARLAVFFPSLLFGVVRARTGGIGAAVFLHAECNIFSQLLGQGYGLY